MADDPKIVAAAAAATIKALVAEHWNVRISDLDGPRKVASFARPRHIAMALCRMFTSMSYPKIGRSFGGRDHTTVMSATRRIRALIYAGDVAVVQTILHVRRHFVPEHVDPCLRHLVPDLTVEAKRTDSFVEHCVAVGIRDPITPEKPGDPDVSS